MIGSRGLIRDTVARLEGSGLLRERMGGPVKVYTERAGSRDVAPFILLDIVGATQWNTQSYRGTEYVLQVSAFFMRTEQGTTRGTLDIFSAMEIIRNTLDDADQFALEQVDSSGPSLNLLMTQDQFEEGAAPYLVLRQYTDALPPIPDPDGEYIMAACRFRCLVGIAN
jgi:hypothetical protein